MIILNIYKCPLLIACFLLVLKVIFENSHYAFSPWWPEGDKDYRLKEIRIFEEDKEDILLGTIFLDMEKNASLLGIV